MTDPGDVQADETETNDAASAEEQDDTDDIVVTHSRWRRLIQVATLSLITFMLIGVPLWTLINALTHPAAPVVQPPVKPAKGPIDGTYRVTRSPGGNTSAHALSEGTVETEWWAFQ
jgi:hypothetical protein